MSQVVKERPAVEPRAQAGAGVAAWEVVRVAAEHRAGRAVLSEPRVERVEERVQDRPVAAGTRVSPLRREPGVHVVEAVVLLAVATYFVVGLVGALVA